MTSATKASTDAKPASAEPLVPIEIAARTFTVTAPQRCNGTAIIYTRVRNLEFLHGAHIRMSINNFTAHRAARTARTRRRRGGALAASLVLHGVALVAMFATASGDLVSGATGGGFEGPVFEVALVDPPASAAASAEAASEARMRSLFAKLKVAPADNAVPVAAEAEGDFAKMVERLRERQTPSSQAKEGNDAIDRAPRLQADETSDRKSSGKRANQVSNAPQSGSVGSAGGLWGLIAPCWRDISGTVSAPVTLEVTLDATGRLAVPPKVLRTPGDRLGEARLASEAKALAALAACLPRNDGRFGGRSYRLEFG